jgi:hypothetical protein
MKKRIIALMLATVLCFSTSATVFATSVTSQGTQTGDSGDRFLYGQGGNKNEFVAEDTETINESLKDEVAEEIKVSVKVKSEDGASESVKVVTLKDALVEALQTILSTASDSDTSSTTNNDEGANATSTTAMTEGEKLVNAVSDLVSGDLDENFKATLADIGNDPNKKASVVSLASYKSGSFNIDKRAQSTTQSTTQSAQNAGAFSGNVVQVALPGVDQSNYSEYEKVPFLFIAIDANGNKKRVPAKMNKFGMVEADFGDFEPIGVSLVAFSYTEVTDTDVSDSETTSTTVTTNQQ